MGWIILIFLLIMFFVIGHVGGIAQKAEVDALSEQRKSKNADNLSYPIEDNIVNINFKWVDSNNKLFFIFAPEKPVLCSYSYFYSHYQQLPDHINLIVEEEINCCTIRIWHNMSILEKKIIAPRKGIFVNMISLNRFKHDASPIKYEKLFYIDYDLDAINDYIKAKEIKRIETIKELEEQEKKIIKQNILKKQKKRALEKSVRQELIDSGELFGEESKRPPITREIADAVFARDGGKCVYCGSSENLQFDHIIPFSKGGATNVENLQLLCQKCNLEKSDKIG